MAHSAVFRKHESFFLRLRKYESQIPNSMTVERKTEADTGEPSVPHNRRGKTWRRRSPKPLAAGCGAAGTASSPPGPVLPTPRSHHLRPPPQHRHPQVSALTPSRNVFKASAGSGRRRVLIRFVSTRRSREGGERVVEALPLRPRSHHLRPRHMAALPEAGEGQIALTP